VKTKTTKIVRPKSPVKPTEPLSPTPRRVKAALAALGGTSPEIAASLEKHRIKAEPNNGLKCALAAFLKKWFGVGRGCNENCAVAVSRSGISFGPKTESGWPRTAGLKRGAGYVSLDHQQSLFAFEFDSRRYPNLVKKGK
jgi:hypothetical protein